MNDDRILEQIRAIIDRVTGRGRAPQPIGRDTRLADELRLDSIELLEVVVACEAEFGIVFADRGDLQPAALETLGSLVDLVQQKRAPGANDEATRERT